MNREASWGYSPWGHKELEMTEGLHTHTYTHTHTYISSLPLPLLKEIEDTSMPWVL